MREILRAQQLGHGPGDDDEPWTLRSQRDAQQIYAESLPNTYLADLADQFSATARTMSRRASPASAEFSWHLISSYLFAASQAIDQHAHDLGPRPASAPAADLAMPTPSAVRVDKLAAQFSHSGLIDLAEAADEVVAACQYGVPSPNGLSDDERKWIERLIDGNGLVEIAELSHLSRSTLQRRLNQLWRRIGARNQRDGIVICVRNGWLD